MKISYRGGRSVYEVTFNRKAYHFNKENGRILETNNQGLINYIFSLPNRNEFIVVEEAVEPPPVRENEVFKTVDKIVEIVKKPVGRPKGKGGK